MTNCSPSHNGTASSAPHETAHGRCLFDENVSVDFSLLGTVTRDTHDQPIANLPEDFLESPSSTLLELNLRVDPNSSWSAAMVPPAARPLTQAPKDIVELSHRGVSGFNLNAEGHIKAQYIGHPLRVVPARFLAVSLDRCSNNGLLAQAQPFKIQGEHLVLPVLGDFHVNGEPLSQELCSDLGLLPIEVRSSATNATTVPQYPVYAQGGRSIMIPGQYRVPVVQTKDGFKLATTSGTAGVHEQPATDPSLGTPADFLQGVAVQFTGVGTTRYIAHWRAKEPNGKFIGLTEHEVVANDIYGNGGWVQDKRSAGKPGIFLGLPYQHWATSPVGGLPDDIAQARDELLLSHGATMASVTVSHIRLIERANLEALIGSTNMISRHTGVDVKVILDNTHRLDTFLPPAGHKSGNISLAIRRHFGCERDEFLKKHQKSYLTRLARTLGRNANVCLRCSLTLPADQSIEDNLGLYGGLHDSGNFIALENRLEALPVIEGWIKAVHKVSRAAGMDEPNLSCWSLIHPFCEGLIDANWADKMVETVTQFQNLTINELTTLIATEWVLESMIREGRRFNPTALVSNVLNSDVCPRKYRDAQLNAALMKLAQGLIDYLDVWQPGSSDSTTKLTMSDLYPTFARIYVLYGLNDYAKTLARRRVNLNPHLPMIVEEALPNSTS